MDILLEQLVYGSFPFWDRGYDVLARSPGCRADWLMEVLAACRGFGEAPSGVTPAPALFSIPLPSGPRAVVGVEPLGLDDRGRPGALAFHALLVAPRDFRKAGSDPFAFAGALRRDWSASTTLDPFFWTVEPKIPPDPPTDPRARRIAGGLSKGRRVAIESPGPIDRLAREVWPLLPKSTRRSASVATWAFGNANRFDLVALPRLAGVELDRSYLDPASIDADPGPDPTGANPRRSFPHSYAALAAMGFALLLGAWPIFRALDDLWGEDALLAPRGNLGPEPPRIAPERRARIVAGLRTLADRLDVGGPDDPGQWMARIADRFRYRGEFLTPAELTRLAAEGDPDRDRALAWHGRIARNFAHDPLPADFLFLPLENQLGRIARSFQLDPSTPLDAIPGALLEILSREGPIRPTPLAARYPALSDYARFLGKLPRRD